MLLWIYWAPWTPRIPFGLSPYTSLLLLASEKRPWLIYWSSDERDLLLNMGCLVWSSLLSGASALL